MRDARSIPVVGVCCAGSPSLAGRSLVKYTSCRPIVSVQVVAEHGCVWCCLPGGGGGWLQTSLSDVVQSIRRRARCRLSPRPPPSAACLPAGLPAFACMSAGPAVAGFDPTSTLTPVRRCHHEHV